MNAIFMMMQLPKLNCYVVLNLHTTTYILNAGFPISKWVVSTDDFYKFCENLVQISNQPFALHI